MSATERRHASLEEQHAGRCRHFNGMQNERCEKGHVYREIEAKSAPPCHRLPCLRWLNDAGATCPDLSLPTAEETAAYLALVEESDRRMAAGKSACCNADLDTSQVIKSGRHEGHGPRFCTACRKVAFIV